MTAADMIWNRACGDDPLTTLPGDRALSNLLRAHGLIMNGGVLHGVECLTAEELSDSETGYRYFGLDAVASLLIRARRIFEAAESPGSHEPELNREYIQLASDGILTEHFERRFKSNPSDFAPLRPRDMR